jgi:hypothetical protein
VTEVTIGRPERAAEKFQREVTYQSTIDWLVDAIPDAAARAKIFGATARELYFNGA